jgi:hypothetical protein
MAWLDTYMNFMICASAASSLDPFLKRSSVAQTDWTGGHSFYSDLEEGMHLLLRYPHDGALRGLISIAAGSYWFVSHNILGLIHSMVDTSLLTLLKNGEERPEIFTTVHI